VQLKQRFVADQREDLPQFNATIKFIEDEFRAYAKFFITPVKHVLKNWLIENAGGLKVRVNQGVDSLLFNTERTGNEDFYRHLTTDDVLDITLPDNVTSFVEVQIFEQTCAPDTVAIWDTSANNGVGEEFSQTVDIQTEQAFRLVSNTIAFTNDVDKVKLAEVTTSGGVVTLITDSREFLFHLETDFVFGSPRKDEDNITNLKNVFDSITTSIKEFKGSANWFDDASQYAGLALLERMNYVLADGGKISFENPTTNELNWSAPLRIIVPNQSFDYSIAAQAVTILDDEVAFVTLPNIGVTPGGPLTVSIISNGSYLLDSANARNFIIAYRSSGKVYVGNAWQNVELESGEENELGDGITTAHLTATGLTDENDSTPPYTSTTIIGAGTSFTAAISAIDAAASTSLELSPLKLEESGTPDAKLNISPEEVQLLSKVGKSTPPILNTIPNFVASTINFQTQATTGGTIDITFPASTVGQFRRCGFTFLSTGTLKAIFSAEAATLGAVVNPGTLFDAIGLPIGWIDLECTDAGGEFKTAGSSTNIIENEVSGTPTIHILEGDGIGAPSDALDSSFALSDASVPAVNSSQPVVVSGVTEWTLGFSYTLSIQPGKTRGGLEVRVDGKTIPRKVSGSTVGAFYEEVSTTKIKFWRNLTSDKFSLEVVK